MMYGELYQYFIQHRQLPVPGIGTFLLERKPALSDFPNKIINAPTYSIILKNAADTPAKSFFNWLAAAFGISDRDAVIRFNDFVYNLKQRLTQGDKIHWNGVGVLSAGLAGEIKFEPELDNTQVEAPVKAEKVIRENAQHTVRVGEDERTSAEMIDYLSQPAEKRKYWWALALAMALLAIMFIGWYLSAHGLATSAAGNSNKIEPAASPATYKIQP